MRTKPGSLIRECAQPFLFPSGRMSPPFVSNLVRPVLRMSGTARKPVAVLQYGRRVKSWILIAP